MWRGTDTDLLMIGKTGRRKSALGNAILKREQLFFMPSTESVTTEIAYDVYEYIGKFIKVVDGPGVGDTRLDKKDSMDLVVSKMGQAVLINPRGYHANEEKIEFHYDKPITPPQVLSAHCEKLIKNVNGQDKGTGAHRDSEEKFKSLQKSVDDAIILVQSFATEERKKLEQKEQAMMNQKVMDLQKRRQDFDDQKKKNEEILAIAMRQNQVQAQKLDAKHKECKTGTFQKVVTTGLGYVALAAGMAVAPEVTAELWHGASMYAANQNK